MKDIWLIYNPRSRTADEAVVAEIEQQFFESGQPIGRKLVIGEDSMPDAATARVAGVKTILLLSGDGTINEVAQALEGWEGTLIVLPGGTMNLLSHALHGEATANEIVAAMLAGQGGIGPVPTLIAGAHTGYAGIIVGPSSAWGDVREDMRNLDLLAAGSDAVAAISATFNEPGVCMRGADGSYPAIYLEPGPGCLRAYGVRADNARDLFSHGWAWLKGDFRDGPSEPLPAGRTVALSSESNEFKLLVDGEKRNGSNPLEVRLAESALHFYAVRGKAIWP